MTKNPIIKVSIIIPVYNVEEYLEECLSSVCNQTLNNIEIIIINDGSTDNSINIINKYINIYNNIILINQKNKGLSEARNIGVNKATGKYIFFLDSDDFLAHNTIEKMYLCAEEYNSSLVICNILLYWNKSKFRIYNNWDIEENYIYSKLELYKLLLTKKMGCQCCNKLYNREIWISNSLSFSSGKYYEDIDIAFKIIKSYKKAIFLDIPFYYYRMRSNSIVNSPTQKKIIDYIENTNKALQIVENESKDIYKTLENQIAYFKIISSIYASELFYKSKEHSKKTILLIKKLLPKHSMNIYYNKDISFKYKIKYFLYITIYIKNMIRFKN